MRDIALAPDYTGYFAILALQFVLTAVAVAMVMQKIQIAGTYAGQITSMVNVILGIAMVIDSGHHQVVSKVLHCKIRWRQWKWLEL